MQYKYSANSLTAANFYKYCKIVNKDVYNISALFLNLGMKTCLYFDKISNYVWWGGKNAKDICEFKICIYVRKYVQA
jgi:hypothetical protein